jgi:hypothetical protein
MLLKDLWINLIIPQLSPIDLSRLQCVSKQFLTLTEPFQHILDKWKQLINHESSDRCLYKASKQGHKDLVQFFIDKGANDWNWALSGASLGGHKDLVEFFINKGANDWNMALYAASIGGHKDLVQLFIDKGANDWKWALCYAKLGGHRDLVEFFNQKMSESKNPNVT